MPTLCHYRFFVFRSRFHSRNVLKVKKTGLCDLGIVLGRFLLGSLGSAHFRHFLVTEFVYGVLPCTGRQGWGYAPETLYSHYNLSIFKAIAICGSLLDFRLISLYSFTCFANVGCSPTPRQHF